MVVLLLLAGILPATKVNTPTITNAKDIEVKIPDLPEALLKVALCESGNRQFNSDGSVVRGKVNKLDVGRFQINEYWNGAQAKKLGYDIYTWKGNTDMALYLYKEHGLRDWGWSKFCWDRPLEVIKKEKGVK